MFPLGALKIYKYQILQQCFHWESKKYINIKLYNSASIGSRDVPYRWTDRQTCLSQYSLFSKFSESV